MIHVNNCLSCRTEMLSPLLSLFIQLCHITFKQPAQNLIDWKREVLQSQCVQESHKTFTTTWRCSGVPLNGPIATAWNTKWVFLKTENDHLMLCNKLILKMTTFSTLCLFTYISLRFTVCLLHCKYTNKWVRFSTLVRDSMKYTFLSMSKLENSQHTVRLCWMRLNEACQSRFYFERARTNLNAAVRAKCAWFTKWMGTGR